MTLLNDNKTQYFRCKHYPFHTQVEWKIFYAFLLNTKQTDIFLKVKENKQAQAMGLFLFLFLFANLLLLFLMVGLSYQTIINILV